VPPLLLTRQAVQQQQHRRQFLCTSGSNSNSSMPSLCKRHAATLLLLLQGPLAGLSMHRWEAVVASLGPRQVFLRWMPAIRRLRRDCVGIDRCRCQVAGKHSGGCHEYPCVHLSWTCCCKPLIHANKSNRQHAWAAMSSCALNCHGAIIGDHDHLWGHPGNRLQAHFDHAGSCITTVMIVRPAALAPCWKGQLL